MLYSFSFEFHTSDVLKPFLLIVICVFIWFANKSEKTFIRVALSLVLSVLLLLLIFSFFVIPINSYNWAKKQIENNQYQIVEGQVTKYNPSPTKAIWGHSSESFFINDTEFSFFGTENYGYSIFQCDGGVLYEGQQLRIKYLEDPYYNERRICYIEELAN